MRSDKRRAIDKEYVEFKGKVGNGLGIKGGC